jgi:hypothetical protein
MKLKNLSFIGHGFFWLFISVMVFSCNNSKSDKKTNETVKEDTVPLIDTTPKSKMAANPLDTSIDYVVYDYTITNDQQSTLFSNQVRQINMVLVPYDQTNKLKLWLWGTDGSSTDDNDPVNYITADTVKGSGRVYSGSDIMKQRLTRGDFKIFYGARNVGIDAPIETTFQHIRFNSFPDKDTVKFEVAPIAIKANRAKGKTKLGNMYTNPSPPARPCMEDGICDGVQIKKNN